MPKNKFKNEQELQMLNESLWSTLKMIAVGEKEESKKVKKLERILKRGADVNFKDTITGDTPLHHAIKSEDKKIALKLLDYGADILLKNKNGKTPLDYNKPAAIVTENSAEDQLIKPKRRALAKVPCSNSQELSFKQSKSKSCESFCDVVEIKQSKKILPSTSFENLAASSKTDSQNRSKGSASMSIS